MSVQQPITPNRRAECRLRRGTPRLSFDELLAAVDVEGRAGDRAVRHEVHGQGGDVGRADDAADRQRGPELLAALAGPVAVQRGRQRRIDEACRDQVDPDGRDLEREGLSQCGKRGRERGDEREARCGAAAAGAAREQQGASRADLARGVPGDLQRQQEVGVDVAACRVEVELGQRRVVGAGAGDQQVVYGGGQCVEEPLEPVEVGGVEGGDAGLEFEAGAVQAVRVAGGEDKGGSFGPGEPGGLEPDAGAAPDDEDGLPEQVLPAVHGRTVDRGSHGSSGRRPRSRRQVCPGLLRCHVRAGSVRVALVVPGITLVLRRVRRTRETPWGGPWVCGVPQARPRMYALLIPAAVVERCRGGCRRVRIPGRPRSSSDAEASVRRSTGSWPTRSRAGAGSLSCGARREWARARCWAVCPAGSPAGMSREPQAWSQRWSWPMPACTNSARPCWATLAGCPLRSATRSRRCSAAAPAPRPTGSWWGWPR